METLHLPELKIAGNPDSYPTVYKMPLLTEAAPLKPAVKPIPAPLVPATPTYDILIWLFRNDQFAHVLETAAQKRHVLKKGSLDWIQIQQLVFFSQIGLERYLDAYIVLQEIINLPEFSTLPVHMRQSWYLCHAYNLFALAIQSESCSFFHSTYLLKSLLNRISSGVEKEKDQTQCLALVRLLIAIIEKGPGIHCCFPGVKTWFFDLIQATIAPRTGLSSAIPPINYCKNCRCSQL